MNTHSSTRYRTPEIYTSASGDDGQAQPLTCNSDHAQIQQAQRMMQVGSMAGSIAHDMNNLLTVIEGSVTLAADSLPPGHAAQRDLAAISQASRRSSALIRQLLAFVRQQPLTPFPIHLGEAIAGINLLIERILGRNITLVSDIAPDLGLITAVHSQVEQILVNLLTNARDAMPEGGQVTISARNQIDDGGAYVVLEVADTGGGIAPEVLQHMFEPFYTTKTSGKGTGLGLTICTTVVSQLGGRLDLESTPGHGTTARVLLPRLG